MTRELAYAHITPQEVQGKIESGSPVVLVDVRTAPEYARRHIPGVLRMPLDEFATHCRTLDKNTEIICLCEHGVRSEMAAQYLSSQGFPCAATMTGGMAAFEGATESGTE